MGLWKRLLGVEEREMSTMDPLLTAILSQDTITRAEAMNIPAFAGCVKYISETVASLPVMLYRETDGKVEEVGDDPRVALLNEDTGDLLTGYQFKQALAEDLVVEGGGYAYIRRERNEWAGLHYVDRPSLSFLPGVDPIFKRCGIMVAGREYRDFDFIKATRKTRDGVRGIGVLSESQLALAVPYNALRYENVLLKKGGNKRGFLKSEKPLTKEAVQELKDSWRRLYSNSSENVVVLNKGVDFKEASSTSVELQMNENKETNAAAVCSLFTVPPAVLSGAATEDERSNAFQAAVLPALKAIEAALNRDLLLEEEKRGYFWAFDTKEALKGSPEKRFQAYRDGIESNVLQIDEARYMENLPPLGLNFVKLGLQDVLYDPVSKTFYAPNTNQLGRLEGAVLPKGGEEDTMRSAEACGAAWMDRSEGERMAAGRPGDQPETEGSRAPRSRRSVTIESRANPNHDPGSGRFTSKGGGGGGKYAPSPQRNQNVKIQLGRKKYARLCGTLGTRYPGLDAGAVRQIKDAKNLYTVKADGYGGFETLSVKKIE